MGVTVQSAGQALYLQEGLCLDQFLEVHQSVDSTAPFPLDHMVSVEKSEGQDQSLEKAHVLTVALISAN